MICLNDILSFLNERGYEVKVIGNVEKEISSFCSIGNLTSNSITWIKSMDYLSEKEVESLVGFDGVIVTPVCIDVASMASQIITSLPKAVFFEVLDSFFNKKENGAIASTAIVKTQNIGKNVSIGYGSYICSDVEIGDGVEIGNNVSIECPCVIGDNTSIASGVVIGTDGFGYYKDNSGNYKKVSHFGGVIIGKNVDIGANTCIDRGTIGDTCIADGVKIDNLCHIAHNVKIEKNTLVIAQSLLGGSSVIGNNSYIAPGVIVRNQVKIGENSFIGMGAVVTKDVADSSVMIGVPAKFIRENK